MTRRYLEASVKIAGLTAGGFLLAACTSTPSLEDAMPVPVATPAAASAVENRPVPDDSRVFTDAEVDARTNELRRRAGRGGAGGGGSGTTSEDVQRRQEEVLRRIEGSS